MSHNWKTIVTQFFILYYICMTKLLKNWLPVFLWAGLIFYLSAQPGLKSGMPWPYDFILRKGAHITEFAVLFLLLLRAFNNYSNQPSSAPLSGASEGLFSLKENKKVLFWAFCLTILYAISDEFHQSFVVQRVASLSDVAIDSFGVLLVTWWHVKRNHL